MLVIAHRGNNREAPENSREAFQKSVNCGAHRIEMDLQWTRDQKIVIFHDDSLKRIAGRDQKISGTDWKTLQKEITLPNGESIPDLEVVLELFLPKIELNLEIKGRPSEEKICELIRLVKNHQESDKIIFSSFFPEPLERLHALAPELKRAVLWGKDTLKVNPSLFFNPEKFMNRCHSSIFHPEAGMISARLMNLAQLHSWKVFPWVPMAGEIPGQKESLWNKLKQHGVDGLCTNDPTAFGQWLENNK